MNIIDLTELQNLLYRVNEYTYDVEVERTGSSNDFYMTFEIKVKASNLNFAEGSVILKVTQYLEGKYGIKKPYDIKPRLVAIDGVKEINDF